MMSVRKIFLSCAFVVAATGCQRSQLSYATNVGAASVEPIYREQTLSNFAKLLDEPDSLPSQVSLPSGTMQANSSVSPTVSFPLSNMFADAVAVARAPTGSTTTDTRTNTTAGGGASIAGSYGFQLAYAVAPVTDIVSLSNLRAVYMAVLCRGMNSEDQILAQCDKYLDANAYIPPRMYDSSTNLVYDPYYLVPPLCILCFASANPSPLLSASDAKALTKAGILKPAGVFDHVWLYWTGSGGGGSIGPSAESVGGNRVVDLGSAGGRHFYAKSGSDFADFELATLPLPPSLVRPTPTDGEKKTPGLASRSTASKPSLVPGNQIEQYSPGSSEGGSQFRLFIPPPQIQSPAP